MTPQDELMLGNWVNVTYIHFNDTEISTIQIDDLVRINTNISTYAYNPIPLTEEWLLKFGATKYNGNRFYLDLGTKGTLQLFWNIGDDYFICEFSSRSSHVCYFNEHKYVHQLQNLYFSLTGEKLTIK